MKRTSGAGIAMAIASGLSAMAINLPALAADENNDKEQLTEIVVTAEKRAENLQEVPLAISAFTDKTRDLVGIETLEDVSNYTPGVVFNQANDRITIRGISRSSNNLSIDPGVFIYVDGFYRTFNDPVEDSPLFTSQVEVLRGPQGTLNGRNSIGGAISYTSARPTSDFEGEARVSLGNFDERSEEFTFGGPISDSLRFKVLFGDYVQNEGYIQSIFGHSADSLGLRDNQEYQFQLEGNVGETIDWWAKADHRSWDEGFGNSVQIGPFNLTNQGCFATGSKTVADLVCPNTLTPNVVYSAGPGLAPAVPSLAQNISSPSNPYRTQNDTPNRDFLKNDWTYVFQATGHLGFADLKYVGGYNNYDYDLETDYDGTSRVSYVYAPLSGKPPVTINSQSQTLYQELKHFFSNEIDLVSTGDGNFQWVAGLYNYHEHFNQPVTIGSISPQPQLVTPLLGPVNPGGAAFATNQASSGQSNAMFGQIDWKFLPTLKLTAGLRYNKDQKSSDETAREIYWDPTTGGATSPALDLTTVLLGDVKNGASLDGVNLTPNARGFLTRHLAISSDALTGTGGFEWTPMKDAMLYLSYARGYKDAGLNSGAALTPLPYVKPEFVNSYTAGWKQTFDNRFQIDASVFYYNYLGAQYPLALITSAILPTNAFFNINERTYGAEFETTWAATDALRFLIDYSYLHARFTDTNTFSDAYDLNPATGTGGNPEKIDGNKVPGSPAHKIAFNASYTWRLQPGSLAVSGSYLYRSGSTSTVFNVPALFAPGYGQADFRATWTGNGHYQLVAFVRNATNTVGRDAVTGGAYPYDLLSWQLIPPRSYGIEARYRFGDNPR